MTRSEEDALLSDLAEADRHVRNAVVVGQMLYGFDRAYVARLLRHALQIVEGEKP